jgi:hypothetical protein
VRRSEKFLRSFRKQVRSEKHPQIAQATDNQHDLIKPVENKKNLRSCATFRAIAPASRKAVGQWRTVYVKTYPQNVSAAMSVAVVWVNLRGGA